MARIPYPPPLHARLGEAPGPEALPAKARMSPTPLRLAEGALLGYWGAVILGFAPWLGALLGLGLVYSDAAQRTD